MTQKVKRHTALHFLLKCLGLVLMGMMLGGLLAMKLRGQSRTVNQQDRDMIAMTVKVGNMEAGLQELVRKVDALKSEADTTEAMGAGIGVAITFLQILGFFTRSRGEGKS